MVISGIIYAVGALMLLFGVLIWRGETELIHTHHRKNVADQRSYGKAMSGAYFIIGIACCLSATLILFMGERPWLSTAVFAVGFAAMLVRMYFIQKKHNGGIFS